MTSDIATQDSLARIIRSSGSILRRKYSEGKKNRDNWFFSHFMSFHPIYFIFIGWIGENVRFCWVPRNFDFLPTNEIFSQKRQFSTFQKRPFLGVWCRKIDFCENGCIDMAYIMDSGQKTLKTTFPNIFSWKSAISADLSKKWNLSYFGKKWSFLIQKIVLGKSKVIVFFLVTGKNLRNEKWETKKRVTKI